MGILELGHSFENGNYKHVQGPKGEHGHNEQTSGKSWKRNASCKKKYQLKVLEMIISLNTLRGDWTLQNKKYEILKADKLENKIDFSKWAERLSVLWSNVTWPSVIDVSEEKERM